MSVEYASALAALRANSSSTWAPKAKDGMSEAYAAGRVHGGYAKVHATDQFRIGRNDKFFCIGSCFAREIEDAIEEVGLKPLTKSRFLSVIEENPDLFARNEGNIGRPTAFLNRYNLGSMADAMEAMANTAEPDTDLLYDAGNNKFHDYSLTRLLKPLDKEGCLARRKVVLDTYRESAKEADVFVFTFGLCESFVDRDSGKYLNVAPDPRIARGQNIDFCFHNVEENMEFSRRIVAAVRKLNATAKILITVSPVPLDVTFTNHDIVVANSLAKSTLVCVAHAQTNAREGIHYFPSYEIVMNSNPVMAWIWDEKHVADGMVKHIMATFINRHIVEQLEGV